MLTPYSGLISLVISLHEQWDVMERANYYFNKKKQKDSYTMQHVTTSYFVPVGNEN